MLVVSRYDQVAQSLRSLILLPNLVFKILQQILDLEADAQLILDMAEETSRTVSPSAGPISAFYVGYAAALAATSGHVDTNKAVTNAAQKVMKLCEGGKEGAAEGGGWSDTAQ